MPRYQSYAPVVLRLGLVFVFAWFGTSQIMNPREWTALVPSWALSISGMGALTIVHLNGYFEVVAAILLALGLFVRPIAVLLFIHLAVIASHFGLSPIGVRDIGLSLATLSLALFGADEYCLSHREPSA